MTITVEHFYLQMGYGGPRSYAHTQVLDSARRHADRNQRPQVVHAHTADEPCTLTCVGILPGPPPPTRLDRLLNAVRKALA